MNNAEVYNSDKVVGIYAGKQEMLTKPEQYILELIKTSGHKSMLDIGVGAGRTTKFFAAHFDKYTGIDQSEKMIDVCRKRFGNEKNMEFLVLDAQKMDVFNNDTFGFIMFSFNGIDCVNHNSRLMILKEIYRLLKPEGLFTFSSHNIFNIPDLFSFHFPKNPLNLFPEWKQWKKINKINPESKELIRNDYCMIQDGDIDFTTEYYYINPAFQILQLKDAGFRNIRIFSLNSGSELFENNDWKNTTDRWLYYTCTK